MEPDASSGARSACRRDASTATHMPPRNLVFLIDVSGSMMHAAQAAAGQSVAGDAGAEPDRQGSRRDRRLRRQQPAWCCRRRPAATRRRFWMRCDGSKPADPPTAAPACMLAYKVAQDHFIKGGVNRVILATDGDFNVGVTDQGSTAAPRSRKSAPAASRCRCSASAWATSRTRRW